MLPLLTSRRSWWHAFLLALLARLASAVLMMEVERQHRLRRLQLYGCALICFLCALVLSNLYVILYYWDSYRLKTLLVLFAAYLLVGLLCCFAAMRHAKHRPASFSQRLFDCLHGCQTSSSTTDYSVHRQEK